MQYLTEKELIAAQGEMRARLHSLIDHAFDVNGLVETYYYDEKEGQMTIRLKFADPKPEEPSAGTQRQQIMALRRVIVEQGADAIRLRNDRSGAPINAVCCGAKAYGIDRERTIVLLGRMVRNGEAYCPAPDHYRLSSEG